MSSKHNELYFFTHLIHNYTILCYSKYQKHQLSKNECNEGGISPPPWKNCETLLDKINKNLNKWRDYTSVIDQDTECAKDSNSPKLIKRHSSKKL